MPKTKKRKQQDELDKLWAEKVKDLADFKCEYCGKETYLNSHHIFSRSNKSVRWYLPNGICLCSGHHVLTNFSAHKAPMEFSEWIKEYRGDKWFQELRKKAGQVMPSFDYESLRGDIIDYIC